MVIREASLADLDAVWEIFSRVIASGDTYVFDPNTPKSTLPQYWFASYMDTFVALVDDQIIGTYILKPNQIDLGNHIANASYMVHPDAQGKGVGSYLCQHSIEHAKALQFLGIQFNIVVSTNEAALHLWKKYGFTIIGMTPKGFRYSTLGLVDTYIMYKAL